MRFLSLFKILLIFSTFLGLWAFYLEPASIRVNEYSLTLPRWPTSLSGLRIAVLADLHVGSPYNNLNKLEKIVTLTNATSPDLILIPGDLVIQGVIGGTFVPPEVIAPVLAKLRAPLGVWVTLGNHDWWLSASKIQTVLMENGIITLEDHAVPLSYKGTSFWLAGVSDATEGAHDIDKALNAVPDDTPTLLMTHSPDIFPDIPSNIMLTIAGHTHGGQVYLPFWGRPIIPSKYGQRYATGHIVEKEKHLFVSSGIGTSIIPVRFLTPPEITLLTLNSR